MIPFNVFGHTKRAGAVEDIPIVWVDAQDTGSYTLSGNDVLTLLNKGSLGGAMTLNGSVKFANSGFESWSASTSITRDLGETFLPTNSFTIVTTLDYTNKKSNSDVFSGIYAENSNRIYNASTNGVVITPSVGLASNSSFSFNGDVFSNPTGAVTLICSYDFNSNELTSLAHLGSVQTQNIGLFNNSVNAKATILNALAFNLYSGQNNPVFEYRLYDRAFTLTEMQDLQTELNNKYTP